MIFLKLFLEFAKIGLFALGGGPATVPFLTELAEKYDWYTLAEFADMVAVSESTPGPLGVNMATYAGYSAAGIAGGIFATMSLVLPSIVIIILIAKFLEGFNHNPIVKNIFYGIRPAVAGLITVAVIGIMKIAVFTGADGGFTVKIPLLILAVVVFALMQLKPLKKLHPAAWLLFAAIVGIIFKLM